MVTEQSTRTIVKALRAAGWNRGNTVGSHPKWYCSGLAHSFTLPGGHRMISPGVVRKVQSALVGCDCEVKW
jgi:predicted RNA binding protein YcfA (HicA-like mRNA interferase family)